MASVLVIGGGGREHAIASSLSRSDHVARVLVAPGNGGTARAVPRAENVSLNVRDHVAVVSLCRQHNVELVVVGPEDPLAAGLADSLEVAGIHCFGPSAAAARIEADKVYAKHLMCKLEIPTAKFEVCTSAEDAKQFIQAGCYEGRLVVKAAGLAAGKGVVVAANEDEACAAVESMMASRQFGEAGSTVLIEERLCGEEVSLMCFTDGHTIAVLPPAQDHKRLLAGDLGPNTGGMGAVAPSPGPLNAEQLQRAAEVCLQPVVDHMRRVGQPYVGVLYAGLMVTEAGAFNVLEYNCRLGDPETQVLLPLLKSDLYELMLACTTRRLADVDVQWRSDVFSVGVVLASAGYPGAYRKGVRIHGVYDEQDSGVRAPCRLVFHAGTSVDSEGALLTSGGRVVTVVALASSLPEARRRAVNDAAAVQFDGIQFRSDIAVRACARETLLRGAATYRDAGVDIGAGDQFVQRIGQMMKRLRTQAGAVGDLGGFGGVFDLQSCSAGKNLADPLLVAGTDGVGTKLLVAQRCGQHRGVGVDLVAMCVNDLLCQGARPLFFLDYIASCRLSAAPLDQLVEGVLDGCGQADCGLLGGETAEMPDVYAPGVYDVAGFAVGVVGRSALLPRTDGMQAGDVLIGLPSSGLHSNGFSLVRKVVQSLGLDYVKDTAPWICGDAADGATLGESLLTPTRIYWRALKPLLVNAGGDEPLVLAAAHITGGGLPGNICRVLPDDLAARLDASTWFNEEGCCRSFAWLAAHGDISIPELLRTFNLGLGMVLVVPRSQQQRVFYLLADVGETAIVVGQLEKRAPLDPPVTVDGLNACLMRLMTPMYSQLPQRQSRVPVAVLVSGTGSNMEALVARARSATCPFQVALVLSNRADAGALERARAAGVPTAVVRHQDYPSREEFDMAVHELLSRRHVQLVCCAGFMRILSARFVRLWRGRLVNTHPSLLPAFPGLLPHRQALQAGVRLSGCTVHLVDEGVDTGAILAQAAVPVLPGDTEETLQERIKLQEHQLFPNVVHMLAAGDVRLDLDTGKLVWKEADDTASVVTDSNGLTA